MNGDQLSLPLREVTAGLSVQSIDGLDPVSAIMATTDYAQRDGAYFHSARRGVRDIKFTLGLEPSYGHGTVAVIRKNLYSYLMPKTNVRMRFRMDQGQSYDIWGRVESFDTPMFVKDPVANINFRCFNPDFFEPAWTTHTLTSSFWSEVNDIEYEGSVSTGFIFSGGLNYGFSGLTLRNQTADVGVRYLQFDYDFLANDWLTIDTTPGAREALLKRGGVNRSLLHALNPNSRWWELQPGNNKVTFTFNGIATQSMTMGYNRKYGGL